METPGGSPCHARVGRGRLHNPPNLPVDLCILSFHLLVFFDSLDCQSHLKNFLSCEVVCRGNTEGVEEGKGIVELLPRLSQMPSPKYHRFTCWCSSVEHVSLLLGQDVHRFLKKGHVWLFFFKKVKITIVKRGGARHCLRCRPHESLVVPREVAGLLFASCHPTQSWLVQAPHGSGMCILRARTFFSSCHNNARFLLFTPDLHKLSLLPVTAEKNC